MSSQSGRPSLPPERKRSIRIQISFSPEEYREFQLKKANTYFSEDAALARALILEREIEPAIIVPEFNREVQHILIDVNESIQQLLQIGADRNQAFPRDRVDALTEGFIAYFNALEGRK